MLLVKTKKSTILTLWHSVTGGTVTLPEGFLMKVRPFWSVQDMGRRPALCLTKIGHWVGVVLTRDLMRA